MAETNYRVDPQFERLQRQLRTEYANLAASYKVKDDGAIVISRYDVTQQLYGEFGSRPLAFQTEHPEGIPQSIDDHVLKVLSRLGCTEGKRLSIEIAVKVVE